MIRIIDNYSFLYEEGAMVDTTRKRKGRIFLYGRRVDLWRGFTEMENSLTSDVIRFSDKGEVVTRGGAIYKLGIISPDYKDFLEVTEKGIPTIANWNIYGSKESGYCLTGDFFPERKAMGTAKIISQKGNILTIQRLVKIPTGESIWADPEQVFVCWNAMSHQVLAEIKKRGKVADIRNFKKFNGIRCKPLLFED